MKSWFRNPALAACLLGGGLAWPAAAVFSELQVSSKGPQSTSQSAEQPAPPRQLVVDRKVIGHQVEPRAEEICRLCNHPVTTSDPVYVVAGHRLAVHQQEVDANLGARLAELVAQLQPRGAFLGGNRSEQALSMVWFWLGLYVLLGLGFGALCAHRALHAGQNAMAWFGIGLVALLFGYLALLTRPRGEVLAPAGVPAGLRKVAATYSPETCPACGAANHPSARACSGCGAKLEARLVSEVSRAGLGHKE